VESYVSHGNGSVKRCEEKKGIIYYKGKGKVVPVL
jgi:hypothetical protein